MPNIFNIKGLAESTVLNAKDKAIALAGDIALNNTVGGHVLPPLPPFPHSGKTGIEQAEGYQDGVANIAGAGGYSVEAVNQTLSTTGYGLFGFPMCFPLTLKAASDKDENKWLLPVEPMITMGGGNNLIKRYVSKQSAGDAKRRGTIKESWSTDDYTITIQGLFTKKDDWSYPYDDVRRLWQLCEKREPIVVECELLLLFGITRIVIEKYDIPFTKGEENQAYTITALSDDDWDLFIKLD